MDFEEFAQQFRKRAAARLTEFEATLEKAQRDLEKSAERAAAEARRTAPSGEAAQPVAHNRPLDYRTPEIPQPTVQPQPPVKPAAAVPEKQQTPAPRKAPGQVKSVLRRR